MKRYARPMFALVAGLAVAGAVPPGLASTRRGPDAAAGAVPRQATLDALLEDGGAALAAGKLDRALKAFGDAAQLAPGHPVALYNLGLVHYRRGDHRSAIDAYSLALASEPDGWLILMNRGSAFSRAGDIAAALRDFDRAARLAPDAPDVFFNRALARVRVGDSGGALGDFTRVLELNCADTVARVARARLLRQLGRDKEADRDLAKAAAHTSDSQQGAGRSSAARCDEKPDQQ